MRGVGVAHTSGHNLETPLFSHFLNNLFKKIIIIIIIIKWCSSGWSCSSPDMIIRRHERLGNWNPVKFYTVWIRYHIPPNNSYWPLLIITSLFLFFIFYFLFFKYINLIFNEMWDKNEMCWERKVVYTLCVKLMKKESNIDIYLIFKIYFKTKCFCGWE